MALTASWRLAGAALLTVTLGGLALPRPAAAQTSIKVVVNGDPITTNEINERAKFLRLVHKGSSQADLIKAATDELVDDRLRMAEAQRVGLAAKDDDVNAAFGRMAAGMKATPAILVQALQAQGVNPATLKARIKVQISWQKTVMTRFSRSVSLSDADVVAALQRQADQGKETVDKQAVSAGTTTEYTLQQVTFVVPRQPPGMGAQRMKEAEALRAKITSCDQLIGAVKGYKETVVKSIGKRTADELPPQFRDSLNGVPVGKLSKPVPGPAAVEMLAVCGTREIQGDFAVRSKVETELKEQEGALLARRYLADLKRQAIIVYK